MKTSRLLEGLSPYDPKFIPAQILLSANENPLDVPADVKRSMLERAMDTAFNRYPDPAASELRAAIAENLAQIVLPTLPEGSAARQALAGIEAASIVAGNGGDELLYNLFLAFGGAGNAAVAVTPGFSVYDIDAHMTGTEMVHVPRREDFSIDGEALLEAIAQSDPSLVILTSPNNPTGDCVPEGLLRRILDATDALVLMDEAYGEFAGKTSIPLIAEHENLCVLRTFSKAYALAGVRLGYVVAAKKVVDALMMVRQPYSVDAVSQAIGIEACRNAEAFRAGIAATMRRRDVLFERLSCISGLETFPSESNFIMVRLKGAEKVWRAMVDDGVLVRYHGSQEGLEGCLRITVGTDAENEAMIASLATNIMKGF